MLDGEVLGRKRGEEGALLERLDSSPLSADSSTKQQLKLLRKLFKQVVRLEPRISKEDAAKIRTN
jgi:hypothetical protein